MLEDDTQERTEQATPKKEQDSKERGLVARSKDFNSLIVLLFGCISFAVFGQYIQSRFHRLFHHFFTFDGYTLQNDNFMINNLKQGLQEGFFILLPIMMLIFFGAIVGILLMGGWSFSLKNVALKFERLDPIKGLLKIFSLRGLMELFKSFVKVFLVLAAGLLVYYLFFEDMVALGDMELNLSISSAVNIIVYAAFIITCSLIIIALFDVPFQIWDYRRQLMMTKQEIRDEYKDTEGKPEVKSKLQRMQRKMSRLRMMTQVPKADVIITNPTHFAVALKYDEGKMKAPIVVAKGADLIANKIIEIGKEHTIPIISMPPLARSIFHHTEIGDEIPQKLYVAVAQILAYVYQLKQYRKGKSKKPKLPTKLDIPSDMIK
jgi:flagellar biosynthetic protein FlhB